MSRSESRKTYIDMYAPHNLTYSEFLDYEHKPQEWSTSCKCVTTRWDADTKKLAIMYTKEEHHKNKKVLILVKRKDGVFHEIKLNIKVERK